MKRYEIKLESEARLELEKQLKLHTTEYRLAERAKIIFICLPVLSEEFDFCIVFEARNEIRSAVRNVLKPIQIIVSLIEGVDAVRNDDYVLSCRSNIRHFPVAQHHKTGEISG